MRLAAHVTPRTAAPAAVGAGRCAPPSVCATPEREIPVFDSRTDRIDVSTRRFVRYISRAGARRRVAARAVADASEELATPALLDEVYGESSRYFMLYLSSSPLLLV